MMAERKEVLKAEHLKKIYNYRMDNEFTALNDISFTVYEGDFTAVMGPSGAGKSTFINNISTIDDPTFGSVYINGKDVRTMSSAEIGHFRYENLGFIFQDFNLLDTHTLYENIAMPMSLAHEDRKKTDARVHQLASETGIEELLPKYPYECSGGQRQRAAICRALVNDPKIIVADEPTGNLDSANSAELMRILSRLNHNGATIVMVTHDAMVASYSSSLIYIRDGKIETQLDRGDDSQDAYFQKIAAVNNAESRELIRK